MRFSRLLGLLLLILVFVPAVPSEAQLGLPRVGFLDESRLQAASPNDIGPRGTSKFASIIQALGAEPVRVDLLTPIPSDIEVVMLIAPSRPLSLRDSVYIYDFLQRGGRLMIAGDPEDYGGVRANINTSPISGVIETDYGVNFRQAIVAKPWFSLQTLDADDPTTAQLIAEPELRVPHPITAPIVTYDLPIQMWGARNLLVEPFGIDSFGSTFLLVENAFGETATGLFRTIGADRLEYDIVGDQRGVLPLGAIGLNDKTGSAVLLLGDGELFQNDFGLATQFESTQPVYPGNFLLAERVAAWLLQRPPGAYPAVPPGFTWIAVDGLRNEWLSLVSDVPFDASAPALAVTNDHFMYLVLPNDGLAVTSAQLTFAADVAENSVTVSLSEDEITVRYGDEAPTPVPDAAVAFGDFTEIRIPLRLTANADANPGVCLSDGTGSFCLPSRLLPVPLNTIDPAPVRLTQMPLGEVRTSERVNLRAAPSSDGEVTQTLTGTTQVGIVGRSIDGEWLLVRTGGYEGWVATFIVQLNASLLPLPVVQPS